MVWKCQADDVDMLPFKDASASDFFFW